MKKFLFTLGSLSAVFLILLFGVDYIIQEGLKTSNYREISKWNEVIQGGIDAEILIVGSSRASVHFDCEMIESRTEMSCYNLGFDGTNYELQEKMLDLYLKSNILPKRLVWVIDFHSFEPLDEFYGFEQLVPYQDQKEVSELLKMNRISGPYLYSIPIVRHTFNPKMKSIGFQNYFNIYSKGRPLTKGYNPQNIKWDGKFDHFQRMVKKEFTYQIDSLQFLNFEKKLNDLQKRGADIQLIIAPIYHEAKEMISNANSISIKLEKFSNLKGYEFLDYSSDSIGYSKGNFYNGNHLNSKGVKSFMILYLTRKK